MRLLPYGPHVTRVHDSLDPFHGLPTGRRAGVDVGSVWEERTEEESEVGILSESQGICHRGFYLK